MSMAYSLGDWKPGGPAWASVSPQKATAIMGQQYPNHKVADVRRTSGTGVEFLLEGGAKLYWQRDVGYFISGYAANGEDVSRYVPEGKLQGYVTKWSPFDYSIGRGEPIHQA